MDVLGLLVVVVVLLVVVVLFVVVVDIVVASVEGLWVLDLVMNFFGLLVDVLTNDSK